MVQGILISYHVRHIIVLHRNSYNPECLAGWGGPVLPGLAVGGFPTLSDGTPDYKMATGIVITYLLNNDLNQTRVQGAMEWEKRYVEFMKAWTVGIDEGGSRPPFMDVAFSSERSIQDELERISEAEVSTVIISYAAMLIYIVDSKVTLGLGGILIVIISVVSSLGFFGYVGVPTTLLTVEVIPFLVLAVGVDNIFILVQTHLRNGKGETETYSDHVARTVGSASSGMPAVRTFALYAGVALLVDFLLQITAFVALMSLDEQRQAVSRNSEFYTENFLRTTLIYATNSLRGINLKLLSA
ncbi:hypothetical protein J437_LFUL004892, partial [Ladona fulva]